MDQYANGQELISEYEHCHNESDFLSLVPPTGSQDHVPLRTTIRLPSKELQQMLNVQSIRIFLACCVGTILGERCIRPEKAWKGGTKKLKRYLLIKTADDLVQGHTLRLAGYDNFCTKVTRTAISESSFMVVYGMSSSPAVSRIIDHLNTGVLDALKKGFLNAIRFTVHLNGKSAAHVVESYIIRMTHASDNTDTKRAVKSLNDSMLSLVYTLRQMDPIPSHDALFFGIDLHLTRNCPLDYQAAGFHRPIDITHPILNSRKDWVHCEEFDCGNYIAQLSINQTRDTASQKQRDFETKTILQGMQKSSSRAGSHLHPTMSEPVDFSDMGITTDLTSTLSTVYESIASEKLSEPKARVLAPQQIVLCSDRPELDNSERFPSHLASQTPKVRCECRNDSLPGGNTLVCIVCGYNQHTLCYGYGYGEGRATPAEHVCYNCLLLPEEEMLNQWMPCLVKSRLALQYLYDNHTRSATQQQLLRAMRYSPSVLSSVKAQQKHFYVVLTQLEEEGFIDISKNVIRSGSAASYKKAWERYLNPRAMIAHHYAS